MSRALDRIGTLPELTEHAGVSPANCSTPPLGGERRRGPRIYQLDLGCPKSSLALGKPNTRRKAMSTTAIFGSNSPTQWSQVQALIMVAWGTSSVRTEIFTKAARPARRDTIPRSITDRPASVRFAGVTIDEPNRRDPVTLDCSIASRSTLSCPKRCGCPRPTGQSTRPP